MQQIRHTEVIKASVEHLGVVKAVSGTVKLKAGGGKKGSGAPIKKVSVQEMIDEIKGKFPISDTEAIKIKEVMETKIADQSIRATVIVHREDHHFLEGAYRGQVNGEIQVCYTDLGRYDELADPKYTDQGGIFDIMAITVIQTHLQAA